MESQTLGRVDKGVKCSISGCGNQAVRSISVVKVRSAGLNVRGERRAYLCKEHYKEYKKRTKKDKQLERMRYKG
jgi:hypothetical protein